MIDNTAGSIKKNSGPEYVSKETFEFRLREIAKCKRDIVYFAEKYFRINNLDKGIHVIQLYDIQKEFLKFLVDNNRVICSSGRQQGKCVYGDTLITVRNKETGEIMSIPVKYFHELQRK